MRMQSAETSKKIILPCGRRVHLHKSASFKMIVENIQTNHKKDGTIDAELIEI